MSIGFRGRQVAARRVYRKDLSLGKGGGERREGRPRSGSRRQAQRVLLVLRYAALRS